MAHLQPLDALIYDPSAQPGIEPHAFRRRLGLAEIRELVSAGDLRLAVDVLLRLEEVVLELEERAEVATLLAQCYARLGLQADTSEWLAKAQRRSVQARTQSSFDATHVAILHCFGHEVNAIRIANQLLGRQSRRVTDPERMQLLGVLGSAYLRLGQVNKAQQCADAMIESHCEVEGRWVGFALLGEIKLWSVVRQHPAFMAEVLSSNDMSTPRPAPGRLISDAIDAYAEARAGAPAGSVARRQTEIGLARATVAGRPDSSEWSKLEANIAWLHHRGLCQERDTARLHLGTLLLLHRRAVDARRWLVPLADAALSRSGLALEHDALYFASVACSESGLDRSALLYLNRYNVRIREQHLSRATLPPPNLERAIDTTSLRSHHRRRGETDREIVDQVVTRVRLAPQARFDARQLAQQAGISRRTLENDFRRVTGLPPKEFATRLKLLEFERLVAGLKQPSAAELEQMARGLGFSSHRSLQRCAERIAPIDDDKAAFLSSVLSPR